LVGKKSKRSSSVRAGALIKECKAHWQGGGRRREEPHGAFFCPQYYKQGLFLVKGKSKKVTNPFENPSNFFYGLQLALSNNEEAGY